MDQTLEYKGRIVRYSAKQDDGGWQYHYTINGGDAHVSGVLYATEQEALAGAETEARAEVDEERI
jgi:hypothetical protein